MRTCYRCKTPIAAERLDILPETQTCAACSNVQGYVGAMVYDHKTAGRLVYVRPENKEMVRQLSRFSKRART